MTSRVEFTHHTGDSELPDECLFAVIGLRSAIVPPGDKLPNGAVVVGGIQVQINCDPNMVVEALLSIAEAMNDIKRTEQARAN